MIQLLYEYKQSRKELNHMLTKLGTTEQDNEDKKIINSMIRDVSFIIDWIEQGGNPDEMRGVDIRSVYYVSSFPNMDILPDLVEQVERKPLEMTNEQRHMIHRLLMVWSEKERDCLLMYVTENKSMGEIAEIMHLSKSTVQTNINRAKRKIVEVTGDKQLALV